MSLNELDEESVAANQAAGASFPGVDLSKEGHQRVNPFSIDPQQGIQSRAGLNRFSLARYREAMLRKDWFPPARVFVVDGGGILVDGFHRHLCSQETIAKTKRPFAVEVEFGTMQEALRAALTANTKNSTTLTRADDIRRLDLAHRDPTLSQLSVRKLADELEMSKTKVGEWRASRKWKRSEGPQGPSQREPEVTYEPFSRLTPLALPHGTPRTPAPFSPETVQLLQAVMALTEGDGAVGSRRDSLLGVVSGLDISGASLDRALREFVKFGHWAHRAREADELVTAGEAAERDHRDDGADIYEEY